MSILKTTSPRKSRLFLQGLVDSDKPHRFAAINADDAWGRRLLTFSLPDEVLTYGLHSDATVSVVDATKDFAGLSGSLRVEKEVVRFSSRLLGEPHLYNILAAATAAYAMGVSATTIAEGIGRCDSLAAWNQLISGQPFTVLVDYAHKPDALEKSLIVRAAHGD